MMKEEKSRSVPHEGAAPVAAAVAAAT